MNNSIQHSARISAPVERASDSSSASSTSRWLNFSASSVRDILRQIPNPAYYLTSAPGRVLTLLALPGRGLSLDTVADDTVADVRALDANVRTTGYHADADIHPLEAEYAWAAKLDDQYNPQDNDIISREKRSPRGGRGGGGRAGGGRSSSSGRSGRSRGLGGSSGAFRRTHTVKTKNYFTGKHKLKVHGQQVDLYKNMLYTKTGKLKKQITTSRGEKYDIKRSGNWLRITTKDRVSIATLPAVRQQSFAGFMFRMSVFSIALNQLSKPDSSTEMLYLFHHRDPFRLTLTPNPDDNSMVDIGYYNTSPDLLPTANNTTMAGDTGNGTTLLSPSGKNATAVNQTGTGFVKLSSVPKDDKISFVLLNNPNTKPSVSTSSSDAATTPPAPGVTPTPSTVGTLESSTDGTQPPTELATTSPVSNSGTATPLPSGSTDILASSNITQINALIAEEGVATNVVSQLLIMAGGKIVDTLPFKNRVSKFLMNSNNDTVMTFSMLDPKEETYSNVAESSSKPGYLLTPLLSAYAVARNIREGRLFFA